MQGLFTRKLNTYKRGCLPEQRKIMSVSNNSTMQKTAAFIPQSNFLCHLHGLLSHIALSVPYNLTYYFIESHASLASLVSTQRCALQYFNETQVTLDSLQCLCVPTSVVLARFSQPQLVPDFLFASMLNCFLGLSSCLSLSSTRWQLLSYLCHSDCALKYQWPCHSGHSLGGFLFPQTMALWLPLTYF